MVRIGVVDASERPVFAGSYRLRVLPEAELP